MNREGKAQRVWSHILIPSPPQVTAARAVYRQPTSSSTAWVRLDPSPRYDSWISGGRTSFTTPSTCGGGCVLLGIPRYRETRTACTQGIGVRSHASCSGEYSVGRSLHLWQGAGSGERLEDVAVWHGRDEVRSKVGACRFGVETKSREESCAGLHRHRPGPAT